VHVITVKPGFVDTPMTKDFEKGILWADPSVIAQGIIKAIEKKWTLFIYHGFGVTSWQL
jgi:NAD(P)-dependent dehydrogenase (short-subunit alcohol dehydrogenase family)